MLWSKELPNQLTAEHTAKKVINPECLWPKCITQIFPISYDSKTQRLNVQHTQNVWTASLWRRIQYDPPKRRWLFTSRHGVPSMKTSISSKNSVRTSNEYILKTVYSRPNISTYSEVIYIPVFHRRFRKHFPSVLCMLHPLSTTASIWSTEQDTIDSFKI
jgi:hypothetical protein